MELPQRKPNRLPYYDYSGNGAYFVTICVDGRKNRLSDIVGDGFPVPKSPGRIAEEWIRRIPERFPTVLIDHYVVMPNHIHILLRIDNIGGTGNPSPTLGMVIGWYKHQVTKHINKSQDTIGDRFFQRSYHDHIIRGEKD